MKPVNCQIWDNEKLIFSPKIVLTLFKIFLIQPIKRQCCHQIETSQLICVENQLDWFLYDGNNDIYCFKTLQRLH